MKALLSFWPLLAFISAFSWIVASTAYGDQTADPRLQEFEASKVLAVKMYPDAAKDGSELVLLIGKMDQTLAANHSNLYNCPSKPFILAAEAANMLKIPPHWENLTETDRNEAFSEMGLGLVVTGELSPGPTSSGGQQPLEAQAWKPGDSLGTITTSDGKTYADAKLTGVDPDGISVLVSDGGAKISFETLSPDLQKRFGYDPQKALFFAQQKFYENKIAGLEAQVYQLQRSRQANTSSNQSTTQSQQRPMPTVAGYTYFYNNVMNTAGPTLNGKYRDGQFAGMTNGQVENAIQQQWAALSYDQQMAYEQDAKMFGASKAQSPQSQGQQIQYTAPTLHTMVISNSDGTFSTATGQ